MILDKFNTDGIKYMILEALVVAVIQSVTTIPYLGGKREMFFRKHF